VILSPFQSFLGECLRARVRPASWKKERSTPHSLPYHQPPPTFHLPLLCVRSLLASVRDAVNAIARSRTMLASSSSLSLSHPSFVFPFPLAAAISALSSLCMERLAARVEIYLRAAAPRRRREGEQRREMHGKLLRSAPPQLGCAARGHLFTHERALVPTSDKAFARASLAECA